MKYFLDHNAQPYLPTDENGRALRSPTAICAELARDVARSRSSRIQQPQRNMHEHEIPSEPIPYESATAANRPTPSFLNPPMNPSLAARSQAGSRCPFMLTGDRNRRHHYCNVAHYPYVGPNANHNVRPPYAPHETLWYRQQNNQELRRHFMNHMPSVETSTDFSSAPPSRPTVNQPTGSVYCHQHPSARHPSQFRSARNFLCTDPRRHRNVYAGR